MTLILKPLFHPKLILQMYSRDQVQVCSNTKVNWQLFTGNSSEHLANELSVIVCIQIIESDSTCQRWTFRKYIYMCIYMFLQMRVHSPEGALGFDSNIVCWQWKLAPSAGRKVASNALLQHWRIDCRERCSNWRKWTARERERRPGDNISERVAVKGRTILGTFRHWRPLFPCCKRMPFILKLPSILASFICCN